MALCASSIPLAGSGEDTHSLLTRYCGEHNICSGVNIDAFWKCAFQLNSGRMVHFACGTGSQRKRVWQ